jgi:hypothetical protein
VNTCKVEVEVERDSRSKKVKMEEVKMVERKESGEWKVEVL